MNIVEFVTKLTSIGPQALALVGAVLVLLTAVHTFFATVALALPAASPVARFFAVGAVDVEKIAGVLKTVLLWVSKFVGGGGKGPGAGSAIGLVFLVLMLPACASFGSFTPGAKTVLKGIDEAAHVLCMLAHAKEAGVSPEQVAATACDTEAKIHPWIAPALGAQRAGAIQAGLERDAGAP